MEYDDPHSTCANRRQCMVKLRYGIFLLKNEASWEGLSNISVAFGDNIFKEIRPKWIIFVGSGCDASETALVEFEYQVSDGHCL